MTGPYPTYAPSYGSTYTIGPPPRRSAGLATSPTEVTHLSIAFVVLTLDFLLLLGGLHFYQGPVVLLALVAAGAVLSAFVAHEMAHKISAQQRGYWAEFRLSPLGLMISLITAAAGFIFAAPGATVIGGMASPQDWGRTSLAGPATNFVFALAFLGGAFVAGASAGGAELAAILLFLAYINGWFAAFNMIPFGPLDGAKVLRWSRGVWVAAFLPFAALAGALFFFVSFGALP